MNVNTCKSILQALPSSISRLKIFCILPMGVTSKNVTGDLISFLKTLLCSVVEALIVVYVIANPRSKLVSKITPMKEA